MPTAAASGAGGPGTGAAPSMFVYGTLRFPAIVAALLGRTPTMSPAEVEGWRAAALPERVYPGLVPAPGRARCPGTLLTGLSASDRAVLDLFEGAQYEARELPLCGGGTAVAYLWRDLDDVQPWNWDPDHFAARYLAGYVARCRALRSAAIRSGQAYG